MRVLNLLIAPFLLLAVVSCTGGKATYTDWKFTHDGKAFVVAGFKFIDQRNLILFEVVDDERKYISHFEGASAIKQTRDPIDSDSRDVKFLISVVKEGTLRGEPTVREQNALVPGW